jgi:enhancing lycopene biosynthesis protein 2
MTKVAVILSGCGHQDGAEIRESVLSLLYLDQQGAAVEIFAPDITQASVMNHLTGAAMNEQRNVLVEAARIARGDIRSLSELRADDFDALVIPGGFGVAKNLSDFAGKGTDCNVQPDFADAVQEFAAAGKPIGAICIAPAVIAAVLGKQYQPTLTIGENKDVAGAIEAFGAKHRNAPSQECVVDEKNRIVSCSAYMRDDSLTNIAKGIEALVKEVLVLTNRTQNKDAHKRSA